MRMMLKAVIPTESGNAAIDGGHFREGLEQLFAQIKPEAAYFITDNGKRCMLLFFDVQQPSDVVVFAEPIFHALNAEISYEPAMNRDDLMKGLATWEASAQATRREAVTA